MVRVVVISLERSIERRNAIARQLNELGVDFEFFRAVDALAGEHLAFPSFRKNLMSRYGYRLAAGEAACFASHAEVWRTCAADGEPVVILEDNALLEAEFPAALQTVQDLVADGVDLVRLSATYTPRYVPVRPLKRGSHVVRFLKGGRGSTAYALSPSGAQRLLTGVATWAEPLDDYLDRFWVHKLPLIAIVPFAVRRSDVATDIHGRVGPIGLILAYQRLVKNWDGWRRNLHRMMDPAYRRG